MRTIAVIWLLLLGVAVAAFAHDEAPIPASVEIRPQDNALTVEVSGGADALFSATKLNERATLNGQFAVNARPFIESYVNAHLQLRQGEILSGTVRAATYEEASDPDQSLFRAVLHYPRRLENALKPFTIASTLFAEAGAPTVLHVANTQKELKPGERVTLPPEQLNVGLSQNLSAFAAFGARRLLAPLSVLLVLALLLVVARAADAAKIVGAFVLGGGVAALVGMTSPMEAVSRLAGALLAVSLLYLGLENVLSRKHAHRFVLAGVFGFAHGLGFADALRGADLPTAGRTACILAFVAGASAATALLSAAGFAGITAMRRKFESQEQYGGMPWLRAMHLASWGVVAFGAYWLLSRVIGG